MNQRERKQQLLESHYKALENLAELCGVELSERITGKKLSNTLRTMEAEIYKPILDDCNGEYKGNIKIALDHMEQQVQLLFNNNLKGFFINTDPRGYALKISDKVMNNEYFNTGLQRDWGGYGLLAPEITEK